MKLLGVPIISFPVLRSSASCRRVSVRSSVAGDVRASRCAPEPGLGCVPPGARRSGRPPGPFGRRRRGVAGCSALPSAGACGPVGSLTRAVGRRRGGRRTRPPTTPARRNDALWSSEGVGGQLLRVVGGIGGTTAPGLAWMGLQKPAAVEDAHQLAAQADLHLLPRWAQGRRHRVEGVLARHVVVRMNFGCAPIGDLVGLAIPGQRRTFLFLKDLQRLSPGVWIRRPATSRHQRAASSLRWARSLNSEPLKKRSLTYWTPRSTWGLSLGWRTRAGSVMKPRRPSLLLLLKCSYGLRWGAQGGLKIGSVEKRLQRSPPGNIHGRGR